MKTKSHGFAPLLLAGAFLLAQASPMASAKEYLLTGVKPGKLVLIDAAAREVDRVYDIPDSAPGPLTITPSPDGKVAYVICNRWESVAGIDLDSGEQVFRADFSTPTRRVKAMFGMDISPDGKELYVFHSPVELELGEYQVEDTYVGVYDTSAGIGAKPLRTFPAPRQTAVLFASKDGSKLYLVNRDITVMDPGTGEIVDEIKVQSWTRPNYYPPDVLDVWPQFEQAGVFSTPYYVARSDREETDPDFFKTGFITVDLETGEVAMDDFENFSTFWFSSVVHPNKREVFGVYTTLIKVDLEQDREVKRVDLDHSYYDVNVSGDGKEVYIGGTLSNIGVYSSETLERIGTIDMPGGANMAISSLRVINR